MKRARLLLLTLTAGALTFALLKAQQEDTRTLSKLLPPGALLYLEAKDLGADLHQWNASTEKSKWLQSANFGVLSRSRLVQRLGQAQDQFADVAGIPVSYNLTNEVAGTRSAFAFYDLPNLKFVYLSRVEAGRLNQIDLWRARSRYEARAAADVPFYVKADPATNRTIAIASYKDWLVIATGEQLMAQTLALLTGATAPSLAQEGWFSEITSRAAAPGDLRLAYNLEALLGTPQFRTYWLQQNNTALREFKSGIADLIERPDGFEEQRYLLRQNEAATGQHTDLGQILRYVPQPISLYRAWTEPTRDQVSEVLNQVVLAERPGSGGPRELAPVVSTSASEARSANDFETRIDQPPFRRKENAGLSALVDAIAATHPVALLHVQTTVALSDGVFVQPQSGAVLECEHPDAAVIQKILPEVTDVTQTGGLDALHVSLDGQFLIVTRLPLARSGNAPQLSQRATYVAAFDKQYEWPHYKQLFALLENRPRESDQAVSDGAAPTFFSGNIGSLGDTLSRLQRADVVFEDAPGQLHETVRYTLSTP